MNENTRSELMQKIVEKYPDWDNYKLMDYFGRLFSAEKMTKEELGTFNLAVMKALRGRK